MIRKILILSLFLLGTIAYSQKLDCLKFKTGKFSAPAFPDSHIVFKDTTEEVYVDGKLQLVWDLKWLEDCKFEAVCAQNYGDEYSKIGDRYIAEIFYTDEECLSINIKYYYKDNPAKAVEFQRGFCFDKN